MFFKSFSIYTFEYNIIFQLIRFFYIYVSSSLLIKQCQFHFMSTVSQRICVGLLLICVQFGGFSVSFLFYLQTFCLVCVVFSLFLPVRLLRFSSPVSHFAPRCVLISLPCIYIPSSLQSLPYHTVTIILLQSYGFPFSMSQ